MGAKNTKISIDLRCTVSLPRISILDGWFTPSKKNMAAVKTRPLLRGFQITNLGKAPHPKRTNNFNKKSSFLGSSNRGVYTRHQAKERELLVSSKFCPIRNRAKALYWTTSLSPVTRGWPVTPGWFKSLTPLMRRQEDLKKKHCKSSKPQCFVLVVWRSSLWVNLYIITGHPVRNKVEIWLVFLQHQTIRGPGKMEGEGDNKSHKNMFESNSKNHQEFQVPQMEVGKNLMFGYFGGGFSLSRIHTAYIGFWIPPV